MASQLTRGFYIELIVASFFAGFKFFARFVSVGLFVGFYFSRYLPTKDLLVVASLFLSTFGLWKIFDYLDLTLDSFVKRFKDKNGEG